MNPFEISGHKLKVRPVTMLMFLFIIFSCGGMSTEELESETELLRLVFCYLCEIKGKRRLSVYVR